MIVFSRIKNLLFCIVWKFSGKKSAYKQIENSIKKNHLTSKIFAGNDNFLSFEKSAYMQNLKMVKFSSQIPVGYSKPKHAFPVFREVVSNQIYSLPNIHSLTTWLCNKEIKNRKNKNQYFLTWKISFDCKIINLRFQIFNMRFHEILGIWKIEAKKFLDWEK